MAASVRNTAIKRIQGDVREMMKEASDQYHAAPLEDNMFDWHFTLRGPRNTEFEGGIYHGRILLPSDYPFKPPNIMLLTPNGRFEVRKKICLSISAYHPEEWQPAWGVRLILEALISFMPTKGEGAIGALDYPPQERRRLAKLSVDFCCETCGKVADLLPELKSTTEQEGSKPSKYAEQIAQLHIHSLESRGKASEDGKTQTDSDADGKIPKSELVKDEVDTVTTESASTASLSTKDAKVQGGDQVSTSGTMSTPAPQQPGIIPEQPTSDQSSTTTSPVRERTRQPDYIDTFLHYLTIAIAVALFALVYRKLLQMQGVLP